MLLSAQEIIKSKIIKSDLLNLFYTAAVLQVFMAHFHNNVQFIIRVKCHSL